MRRLLAFLASLLLIWGCEELFPTEKPMISLDSDQAKSVTVSEDGGSFDVAFTSALSWTAEIVYSDGADGWASLNKTSGEGGYNIAKIKVAVQKNESGEERSAKLVIKSDTVSEEITFTQPAAEVNPGPGPGPEPEPAVFELTEGIDPNRYYTIEDIDEGIMQSVLGSQLIEGIPFHITEKRKCRIVFYNLEKED